MGFNSGFKGLNNFEKKFSTSNIWKGLGQTPELNSSIYNVTVLCADVCNRNTGD